MLNKIEPFIKAIKNELYWSVVFPVAYTIYLIKTSINPNKEEK